MDQPEQCAPVLLILFNRPELTRRVFEEIREARPAQLFVAADGPRAHKSGDIELCRLTREVIHVDWECRVHTLYQETNLGCGMGPATAIRWFFERVEQGIILEDDCLPSPSFFTFCTVLLEHFKDNQKVFAISGTNVLGEFESEYSTLYSYLGGIWGWATWRRAWRLYDYRMSRWHDEQCKLGISNLLADPTLYAALKRRFDNVHKIGTWDYQWLFTRLAHDGLAVVPSKNLVSNIGFGNGATHTVNANSNLACLPMAELEFPLLIDPNVAVNREYDSLHAKKYGYDLERRMTYRVQKKVSGVFKRLAAQRAGN